MIVAILNIDIFGGREVIITCGTVNAESAVNHYCAQEKPTEWSGKKETSPSN